MEDQRNPVFGIVRIEPRKAASQIPPGESRTERRVKGLSQLKRIQTVLACLDRDRDQTADRQRRGLPGLQARRERDGMRVRTFAALDSNQCQITREVTGIEGRAGMTVFAIAVRVVHVEVQRELLASRTAGY